MILKILICDDEEIWLNETEKCLKIALDAQDNQYTIKKFSKAAELLDCLEEESADIVITDIQMPEISGIELAKKVFELCREHTQIIITTIFEGYAQDIFESHPTSFLVKPFNQEKFSKAIKLALKNINDERDTIVIHSKNNSLCVRYNKIMFIESFKRSVTFHEEGSDEICTAKLDDIEKMLPSNFIRCHQSFLVNCKYIRKIANNQIILYSGKVIPVARTRYSHVKKFVTEYFGAMI